MTMPVVLCIRTYTASGYRPYSMHTGCGPVHWCVLLLCLYSYCGYHHSLE